MRLGVVVSVADVEECVDECRAAARHGLDFVWLPSRRADGTPISASALACAVAPHAGDVRIVIELPIVHPIELAEETVVADAVSGGRVVVALRTGDSAPDVATECAQALRTALRPRPFRHSGRHWQLPGAAASPDASLTVLPMSTQFDVPIWFDGAGVPGDWTRLWVLDLVTDLRVVSPIDPVARVTIWPLSEQASMGANVDAEVTALWNLRDRAPELDTVAIALPDVSPARRLAAIETLAHLVRPRLQLEDLSAELIRTWALEHRWSASPT